MYSFSTTYHKSMKLLCSEDQSRYQIQNIKKHISKINLLCSLYGWIALMISILTSCMFGERQFRKQPPRVVLRKRSSDNMQQINRRTAWVVSCKFAAYFQNTFLWEHLWMAASAVSQIKSFLLPLVGFQFFLL